MQNWMLLQHVRWMLSHGQSMRWQIADFTWITRIMSAREKKVFASFKPPTGREQACHVRRGKGRVRTQDLGHLSGACYQLRYRPGHVRST